MERSAAREVCLMSVALGLGLALSQSPPPDRAAYPRVLTTRTLYLWSTRGGMQVESVQVRRGTPDVLGAASTVVDLRLITG